MANDLTRRRTFSRLSTRLSMGALIAGLGLLGARSVDADNFARVFYDSRADQLVITMRYRGTNAQHVFTLKWGACQDPQSGDSPALSGEVLDDQWNDPAVRDYKVTTLFGLTDMPCRPAKVTLRTAPRFYITIEIPPLPVR
jgi:hypothetical protein